MGMQWGVKIYIKILGNFSAKAPWGEHSWHAWNNEICKKMRDTPTDYPEKFLKHFCMNL
jgi:hypothetical protein